MIRTFILNVPSYKYLSWNYLVERDIWRSSGPIAHSKQGFVITEGCSGSCPVKFQLSPRMEIPPSLQQFSSVYVKLRRLRGKNRQRNKRE